MSSLRSKWNSGQSTVGAWLSLASDVSAELVAREGFDYVCVDMQHGAVDYTASVSMFQAIELGGSIPIARVPWNEPAIIGRVLDAGASGVIVPMVNSADEARAVVRACRYAPLGARSYGPTVVGMRRPDYVAWSADHVAVIVMIETAEAVANVEEIVAVPGVDAVYVGPADLSLTLGLLPRNNDGVVAFDAALSRVVDACCHAGVVPGIHCVGAIGATRAAQGFQLRTVASDVSAMRSGLAAELAAAASSASAG